MSALEFNSGPDEDNDFFDTAVPPDRHESLLNRGISTLGEFLSVPSADIYGALGTIMVDEDGLTD
ncbi:MAG: hypothetical protein ACFCBW_19090 [Candidatus Competibacterales bacterium]